MKVTIHFVVDYCQLLSLVIQQPKNTWNDWP